MWEVFLPSWLLSNARGAGNLFFIMILWPKKFYEKLNEDERFFVRNHEVGHTKNIGLLRRPYFLDVALSSSPLFSFMFAMMKAVPTKQNIEYRKRFREAFIEWEAAADLYALKQGGLEAAMYSAFDKTGTPTSDARLEASRRAVERFKRGVN